MNKKNRRAHLESLRGEERTMLFYEAPHKLRDTLRDMAEVFGGERRLALCRELTKIHEEITRTTLCEAIELYREKEPKGEFVLVIEGAPPKKEPGLTFSEAVELVVQMSACGVSLSEAAKSVAADSGYKKGELYRAALEKR